MRCDDLAVLTRLQGHIIVTGSLSALGSFVASLRLIQEDSIPVVALHPNLSQDSVNIPSIRDALQYGRWDRSLRSTA